MIALEIASFWRSRGPRRDAAALFCAGIAIDEIVLLATRHLDGGGYWSGGLLIATCLGVGAAAAAAFLRGRPSKPDGATAGPWWFAAGLLGAVAAFRVSDLVLVARGIPNEDRSLFIGGHEVHHLTFGLLGLAILAVLRPAPNRSLTRGLLGLASGFSVGQLVDELYYDTIPGAPDPAYRAAGSLAVAIALGFAAVIATLFSSPALRSLVRDVLRVFAAVDEADVLLRRLPERWARRARRVLSAIGRAVRAATLLPPVLPRPAFDPEGRPDVRVVPHPRWVTLRLWPALNLAQWISLLWLCGSMDLWMRLDGCGHVDRRVPFVRDIQFMSWNLFPFLMVLLLVFLERTTRRHLGHLWSLRFPADETRPASEEGRLIAWHDRWTSSAYGCWAQLGNVREWALTHKQVYWWDPRFSPAIFWVREAALFVNLHFFIVCIARLLGLAALVTRFLRLKGLKIELLHHDNAGGLVQCGWLCFNLTLLPLAGVVMMAIAWFDHTSRPHLVGDTVGTTVFAGVALFVFVYPLWHLHQRMKEQRRAVLHDLARSFCRVDEHLHQKTAALEDALDTSGGVADFMSIYERYQSANTWPIDLKTLSKFVGLFGPAALFILNQLSKLLFKWSIFDVLGPR